MAVSTFKKMSGIAALAIGMAMALPSAASAQERGWNRGGQQGEARQDGGEQRPAWQGRGGGGENRGGGEGRGGWRGNGGGNNGGGGQQAPRFQAPAQPQAQAPVQVQPQAQPQGINRWLGSRDGGGRSWREDNAQQGARPEQNARRAPWNGGGEQRGNWNRDNDRRQDAQRNWNRDNDRRQDAQRAWGRVDSRNWNGGNRWSDNDGRRWNNDWRRDNRYNWQSYRNANRSLFRGDRYYSPYRNWSYRRLGIGFMLQPLFYSSTYWIDDPWQYRLPDAYGPYRWVRYYDDALLVDIYTGEVVDVINDFFW